MWHHLFIIFFIIKAPCFYPTQNRQERKDEHSLRACFRVGLCTIMLILFSRISVCWSWSMCRHRTRDPDAVSRHGLYLHPGYSLCRRNETKCKPSGLCLRYSICCEVGGVHSNLEFDPRLIKHSIIQLSSLCFPCSWSKSVCEARRWFLHDHSTLVEW